MTWQPIETAPKDGSQFIGAAFGAEPWVAVFEWQDFGEFGTPDAQGDWQSHQWEQDFEPTHWMPLPEPPQ